MNGLTPQNDDSLVSRQPRRRAQPRGLTLIEMLIALPIIALLMAATMVAIDASFMAYADAAEQAGTHHATRLVTHRLLTLVRTSTAHGPLLPETGATLDGNVITSDHIELIDTQGRLVRVEYRPDEQELWVSLTQSGVTIEQPLLGGVTNAQFFLFRRQNDDDLWVLERGTMDVTVASDQDNTLAIENGDIPPIRMIASTKPRKVD